MRVKGRVPGPIGTDAWFAWFDHDKTFQQSQYIPGPLGAKTGNGPSDPRDGPSDPLPAIIPKIAIGRIRRYDASNAAGLPTSVPLNRPYQVTVTVDPPLVGTGQSGEFVEVFILNASESNGNATIVPAQFRKTTKITVTGSAQTTAGSAGQLQIMARLAGTGIAARSNGFSVCAHPSGIKEELHKDLDDPKQVTIGMQTKMSVISDSGDPKDLDQVLFSEIIEQQNHPEPPFKAGSGNFTGAGTAGGQVNDLQFFPANNVRPIGDKHSEVRPDPGPAGQARYLQLHVFKCARCGLPPTSLPSSGFEIVFRVFQSGKLWKYVVTKVGASIGIKFGKDLFGADPGQANLRVSHDLQ